MNTRFFRASLVPAATIVFAMATNPASASPSSLTALQRTVSASATVVKDCVVSSAASTLDFGNIDFIKPPASRVQHANPAGSMKLKCNQGTSWHVGLDSNGTTGSFASQQFTDVQGTMTGANNPAHTLDFTMSIPAGICNCQSGTQTGNSTAQTTVFFTASLVSNQDPPVDTYSGSLVATIFF